MDLNNGRWFIAEHVGMIKRMYPRTTSNNED
jgi:hypothetical protein